MSKLLKELRRTHSHLIWLIPISATEWTLVSKYLLYGVPHGHRAMQRISIGDTLLFYILRKAGGNLAGKIVGVFEVISDWSAISEEGVEEGSKAVYPVRIKLRNIKYGQADFWQLSKSLSFVKYKYNPSFYLQGTPANANRPIPDKDFRLMMRKMR